MKRLYTILPILALIVAGCQPEPYADAIITPNPAYVGEEITFDNYSVNTDFVEWNMGDGATSSSFNVLHYYTHPGAYNVTLRAVGHRGDADIVSFTVDVVGSELKVIVEEFYDGFLIEGASVVLFDNLDDWIEGDWENKGVAEAWTNQYGEAFFSGLSYKKYYVDVFYRVGNEGYHNYFLGDEDPIRWIETQELPGGWDHTFIAYVDAVEFFDKKSGNKQGMRPALRAPYKDMTGQLKAAPKDRPARENKISVKREKK